MILTGSTQSASLLMRVPVGPNLLKVHLVTWPEIPLVSLDTDGGHLGEDPRHRVHAVLGIVLHHRGNLETVLAKLAI